MRDATDVADPPARVASLLVSVGGAIYVSMQLPVALGRVPDAAWWVVLIVLCGGSILVLAVGSRILPSVALRVLWWLAPLSGAVAIATWPSVAGTGSTGQPASWFTPALSALVCYPALLLRPLLGTGMAVAVAASPLVATLVVPGGAGATAVVDAILPLSNIMFTGITYALISRLRMLHAEEAQARDSRAQELEAHASLERQRLLGRIVHDEVLATLVAAMHSPGSPSAELRSSAAVARRTLWLVGGDTGGGPGPATSTFSAADAAEAIETVLGAFQATITVVVDRTRPGRGFPPPVVEAVALAASEAVRNSMRHGRSDPSVAVVVTVDDRIVVDIADDGPGFDPASISAERLGVRQSIVGRMEAVGGAVSFTRNAGAGMTVELRWPA